MKRKQIAIAIIIVVIGGVFWTACKKSDTPAPISSQEQGEEKFFNSHIAVKPAVRAVQDYIRRENSRRPLVKNLMQKAGIPRWDKVLIFENATLPSGRGSALDDSITIMHIPFVFMNGQMVTGSLMVKMAPGDTTMNLISANDYASYGFGNATANAWNAHDVFNILTKLDYEVFGRTKYIVNDGRITGDSQHIRHKVIIDQAPAQTLNDLFVTLNVCNSQTVCVIAGEPGSGSGVCNTYTYCTTYYINFPDGGGGGGGGGTGGGPTGGGGGTGGTGGVGWVPLEECDMDCTEAQTMLNSVIAEESTAASVTNGGVVPPDASGIERMPKSVVWEFLTLNFGFGYKPRYGASFSGIVYRNNSTAPWKWESLTYAHTDQTGGSVPPCASVNLSATVSGPVISADKSKANISISYAAQLSVSCLLGMSAGSKNGLINGQVFYAN